MAPHTRPDCSSTAGRILHAVLVGHDRPGRITPRVPREGLDGDALWRYG